MSFRQFGGLQFASKHNAVASYYNTTGNLLVTQNVGQPNSYINLLSDISGNITLYGNLDVSGNINVSGDVDISGNLYVHEDVDISGNLYVDGDVDISGNLHVQKNIDCSGNVNIRGDVDISGNLHVQKNIDCSGNLYVKKDALINNVTVGQGGGNVNYNTVVGHTALASNISGGNNTAIGNQALTTNNGFCNTALGGSSLIYNTNGGNNTAVGFGSGTSLSIGNSNYNTFLGSSTNVSSISLLYTNSTALGYSATIDASNQIVLGGYDPTNSVPYPGVKIPGSYVGIGGVYNPGNGYALDVSGNVNITGDIDCSVNITSEYMFLSSGTNYTTSSNGVVPKSYVDAISSGLRPLPYCVLCSNESAIDLSGNTQTIDGVTLDSSYNGEAILVNAQGGNGKTPNSDNGIYIVADGPWNRSQYLIQGDLATGTFTVILNGNKYSNHEFVCTSGTQQNPVFIGEPVIWSIRNLPYSLGRGLSRNTVSNQTVISVDSSLNFINYLDNTDGPNPNTINIGTNTNTVNIGKTTTTTVISGNVGIMTSNPQCRLDVNGSVNATSYNSSSDYRIKENVTQLDSTFVVDKLNPVTYLNKNLGKQDIGLIAHELQEIHPELVNGEKDGEQFQSVNYIGLIPILIKEIQELKKEIKSVKIELNELKNK